MLFRSVPAITPDWGDLNSQRGFPMHSGEALGGWKFSNFKDGVFAELFHVNEADANLAFLPDDIDPVSAVMLTDMTTTGSHADDLAEVKLGDTVLSLKTTAKISLFTTRKSKRTKRASRLSKRVSASPSTSSPAKMANFRPSTS